MRLVKELHKLYHVRQLLLQTRHDSFYSHEKKNRILFMNRIFIFYMGQHQRAS